MKKLTGIFICFAAAVLTVVSLLTLPACAASAKLNKKSVDLPIGKSVTLKVSGAEGVTEWTSSDSSVAYIKSSDDGSAVITGKKTGEAYIYAETGGVELKCRVTVKKSFISADTDGITISEGGSQKITFTVKGSKKIMYDIEDTDICSASWGKWDGKNITLTVKGKKSGSTVLRVYAKGFERTTEKVIEVTVKDPPSGTDKLSEDEQSARITELVNAEREKAGVKALKSDPTLNALAAERALELAEYFSHDRPDGRRYNSIFDDNKVPYGYSAENIAGGQKSPDEAMNSWMNSTGHRTNILNGSYKKMGAAVYKDKNGRCYWVQLFTD